MTTLSFPEITKSFVSGPHMGQLRLTAITRKIDEGTEFELEDGSRTSLFFKDAFADKAFREQDLDEIAKIAEGRNAALVDAKGKEYTLRKLKKTAEFGGASGGGSPPDPHELMTAALILHYGSRGRSSIPENVYSKLNNASKVISALKSTAKKIDTTEGDAAKKIDAFDNNFEAFGQAISAADGFLANMPDGGKVSKVYGTGRKWASILSPYKIDDHLLFGKKDYNSSDMIVEVSKRQNAKAFVGISLKKKKIGTADPTIINKTVMGTDGLITSLVRQGYLKAYDKFKIVYKQRSQFFFDVIENAVLNSDFRVKTDALKKLKVKPADTKTYLDKLRKNISSVRSKGANILAEAQKLGQDKMTQALKGDYPEGGVENIYFKAFNEIFTDPKAHKPIVIALLNIIFKTDLKGFLGLRGTQKDEFKFTLITGKGTFKGGKIEVDKATELQETFTTSMITQRIGNPRTSFKVEKTKGKKQAYEPGATAAKLFYTIFLGKDDIADIEIRYKGSIRSEPQFFAVITPHFKQLYKTQVKKDGGHEKW